MKKIIVFLFILCTGVFATEVKSQCLCLGHGSNGSLFIYLVNSQHDSHVFHNVFSIDQSRIINGSYIRLGGEVHPDMAIYSGTYASYIQYRLNGNNLLVPIKYLSDNTSTYERTISLPGLLHLGLNTIEVGAYCTSTTPTPNTHYCSIQIFNITVTQMVGTVTITPKCVKNNAGANTGQVQFLMSGTVTHGDGHLGNGDPYIKVEKQNSGTGAWIPAGNLIHFVSGQYTPNFPVTYTVHHSYRLSLVDISGNPLVNNGTHFPFVYTPSCPVVLNPK